MPPRRRRKRRHALNPMRWLAAMPPVLEAMTKLAAVVAAAATPSLIVASKSADKIEASEVRADSAQTQVEYANANTNAALAIGALLSARLDSAMARIDRLERREARRMRRSPEAMYGPEVPPTWIPQPVKRKKFLGLF
jgi:hypothetical protein